MSVFFLPRSQAFDTNGLVESGAKLNFYVEETSTRKDTYSDADLTTPNANPVVADSSGLFGPIFLGTGGYKVVLTDSADVTIWSQDNVELDSGDSSTVSFTPTGGSETNVSEFLNRRPYNNQWVVVASGQSNMDRTASAAVVKTDPSEPFENSPGHDEYTAVDGGASTTYTYVGATNSNVEVWYPGSAGFAAVSSGSEPFPDGLNNIALGFCVRLAEETGVPVKLVLYARASTPIEKYLLTSTATITGATRANPCVLTLTGAGHIIDGNDIIISGVGGMTELNGNEYEVANSTIDAETGAGTVELLGIDSSSYTTYTSGGAISCYPQWTLLDDQVTDALSELGVASVDVFLWHQGEANGPASWGQYRSTTGGIATYDGFVAQQDAFLEQLRDQSWFTSESRFIAGELLRGNTSGSIYEKDRNDAISIWGDRDPGVAVASSAGYLSDDGTHFDDRWGFGYHAYYDAFGSFGNYGGNRNPVDPWHDRVVRRKDGTPGYRGWRKNYDTESDTLVRGDLLGSIIRCRSSRFTMPDDFLTNGRDDGLLITFAQYSTSETTPGGPFTITGATAANPVVLTMANTLVDGEDITITGVSGMTELNGNTYRVKNRTDTTVELYSTVGISVDGSGFTAYTSGGSAAVAHGRTVIYSSGTDWDDPITGQVFSDGYCLPDGKFDLVCQYVGSRWHIMNRSTFVDEISSSWTVEYKGNGYVTIYGTVTVAGAGNEDVVFPVVLDGTDYHVWAGQNDFVFSSLAATGMNIASSGGVTLGKFMVFGKMA